MIFLILLINFWQSDSIITSTYISDIIIGNGRNDDTLRLYSGNWGELLEYTYHSSGWMIDTIDNSCAIECITLGNVRNDDTIRIYGAGYTQVYEYTYINGSWLRNVIASISDPIWNVVYCLEIGLGRNDDTARIYLGHWNGKIYELSYRNGDWDIDSILPGNGSVMDIAIGNGRNDGVDRVYIGGSANMLFELSYFPPGWQQVNFGWAPGTYCGIALGNGKNDGINRIYSWSAKFAIDGYVMYEWTGPAWTSQILGQGIGFYAGVCLGIGRNDGLYRVYGFTGSNVYEFSYQTDWQQLHIDSLISEYTKITVGQGRNDGIDRVYVGCNNGYIYEYTWIEEAIGEDDLVGIERGVNLKIYPNPFKELTEIRWQITTEKLGQKDESAKLKIYDSSGRLIKIFNHSTKQLFNQIIWDGTDYLSHKLPSGIYFVRFECSESSAVEKVIKY